MSNIYGTQAWDSDGIKVSVIFTLALDCSSRARVEHQLHPDHSFATEGRVEVSKIRCAQEESSEGVHWLGIQPASGTTKLL